MRAGERRSAGKHSPEQTRRQVQTLPIPPRFYDASMNGVLFMTHRQNYLVPLRRHRAFPLAEFLT
jgi:hypothetical protein